MANAARAHITSDAIIASAPIYLPRSLIQSRSVWESIEVEKRSLKGVAQAISAGCDKCVQ
jgi:hypothetical protein